MLGMIAAAALLASVDDQVALPLTPLGGEQEQVGGAAWNGRAVGAGALGLVGGDVLALIGGAALVGMTSGGCEAGGLACINAGAATVALIGIVTIPPTIALLLGREAAHGSLDGRSIPLTVAAQGAAIGLLYMGLRAPPGGTKTAFLLSAAAVHLVGIPLAVGLAAARPAQGATSEAVTPTLSLALRW
jgi:hypothetical protein